MSTAELDDIISKDQASIELFEEKIIKNIVNMQKTIRGFLAREKYKKMVQVTSIVKYTKQFIQEGEVGLSYHRVSS